MFEVNYLENTKYKILLKTLKEKLVFHHTDLHEDVIISIEVCSLQQQIGAYHAYMKAYEEDLPFFDKGYLVVKDFNYQLYLDTEENADLHLRSPSYKNADNLLTNYFYKNRIKNFIKEYASNNDVADDFMQEDTIVKPPSWS